MPNPHGAARDDDFTALRLELEVPAGIAGFGNYLVWMVATRAAELVDAVYDSGVARPSPAYRMLDGHHLPTQSLFAWFILATRRGTDPARMPRDDEILHKAQCILRATMTPAMGAEPQRFRAEWLRDVAALCALDEAELRFLSLARSMLGVELDPGALRLAVAATRSAGLPPGRHAVVPVAPDGESSAPAAQLVIGQVPREPSGFVARDLVAALAAAAAGRVAVICAVTGLRGVGKTQLAAAYARQRVADGWGLVGWINAEDRRWLVAGLAAVAGRLGVADPHGDSAESAIRLRDELQSRAAPGLLVFDNAVSPADVAPFLLASGGTQVVITSTNHEFAQFGIPVDVSVFTRDESVRYLCDRTGLTDTASAAALAAELGDLPLALAQAATVVAGQRLSYEQYLERLAAVPTGHVLRGIRGLYPAGVAAALLDSARAAETAETAETAEVAETGGGTVAWLLRVIAMLSPAGVERHLLAGPAAEGPAQRYSLDEAAERCVAWSLLTWSVSGEELIMHRLLARVLRERAQEAGRWPQTVTEALDLLEPSLFPAAQAGERRDEGSRLVAHVDAAWAAAAGAMIGGNPLTLGLARRLLRARVWTVRQLAGAADLAAAIEAGSRLLADCTELIGEEDRVTLAARHALAVAYKLSGQLTTARELCERSLADRRRLFGDHDLDTLEALNDYAELHLALNLDGEAVPIFEEALRGRERALPPGDYLIFESRINLAAAMSEAGQLPEAIDLDEHTYAERLAAVGPDHPDTDFVRGNLAFKYWLAGRLTEATALNEELYRARQRVFGDHQLTFIAATNLGACYAKTGQLEKAAVLHEETLEARLRLLGSAHPDTMRSRHALALTYADLGRYGEAISLHEENLTERVRYLSPDNPHIADTIVALEAARAAQPASRG